MSRDLELFKKQCNDHETAHSATLEKLNRIEKLKDIKGIVNQRTAKLHSELAQLKTDFRFEIGYAFFIAIFIFTKIYTCCVPLIKTL